MACYVDLRFVLSILINLFFQFFNYDHEQTDIILDHKQYPILFIFITTITLIMILFTSIKLLFDVHQIRLAPGYFSAPVAMSMLASVLLPPSLFWPVFLIIIITSPLHGVLFNILKRFFRCLLHTLRSIPPHVFRFTLELHGVHGGMHQEQLPIYAAPAEVQFHEIVQHAMPDVNNGSMECYVELRFVLPILINLVFQFLNYDHDQADIILDQQYPILFIIIAAAALIMILFTSIKLPFNVHQIRLEPGYFSAPVAMTMLASVLFPPSLFWLVFLIIIITSPFHGVLFNIVECFLLCLLPTLRSIPPIVFRFTLDQQGVPVDQRQLPYDAPAEEQLHEIGQHAMPDMNNGIPDTPTLPH